MHDTARLLSIAVLTGCAAGALAQDRAGELAQPHTPGADAPHWVFLADKGFADAASRQRAIDALEATYPARATRRRMLRRTAPGRFDARDLPVADGYIDAIESLGAQVRVESRWLNAVSVEAAPGVLEAIGRLPCVAHIEPVRRGGGALPAASDRREPPRTRDFYGHASFQLHQINLPPLHDAGYTGEGVVIGVLDTGFRRGHEAFSDPDNPLDVVAEWDFVKNDGNTDIEAGDAENQHEHGTLILGTIRASLPDTLVGGAFGASVILCKTEDIESESPVEEDYYVAGLEFIEFHGGDVATSSLRYSDWYSQSDMDGQTAVTTIAVNVATANGLHCCTAVGNSGHDSDPQTSQLGAPADAFEAITVGAVTTEGSVVGFSSDGPTADGRVKPEVLALGADTWTVWAFDDTGYTTANGTSLSTPLVASAVACLVQAKPMWTPATMRAHLFNTASDWVAFGEPDPLFVRGYGIIDAAAALADDCPADANGDGVVNTQDVLVFLNAWVVQDGSADFNGDGTVNTQDVLAFLNAWVAGC